MLELFRLGLYTLVAVIRSRRDLALDGKLADLGIAGVRTRPRAPTANAIAERIVRTIRTESLDHLIVIDEPHLGAVLAEFADYYNRDRPHRGLGLQSPLPSSVRAQGRVASRPVLGACTTSTLGPLKCGRSLAALQAR